MSVASSKSGNSGCGVVVVAAVVLSLVLAILKAIWWLLLILAVAAGVGACVVRKKAAEEPAGDKVQDPYYTQTCPNCGAQIKVGTYDQSAACSYCGSAFPAERVPQERPVAAEEGGVRGLLADPFKALVALAVVLAVLGIVGLGYSLASDDASSSTSYQSASSSAAASSTSSAATASNGALPYACDWKTA